MGTQNRIVLHFWKIGYQKAFLSFDEIHYFQLYTNWQAPNKETACAYTDGINCIHVFPALRISKINK